MIDLSEDEHEHVPVSFYRGFGYSYIYRNIREGFMTIEQIFELIDVICDVQSPDLGRRYPKPNNEERINLILEAIRRAQNRIF